VEAALQLARRLGPAGSAAAAAAIGRDLTPEEALAQAADEGLTLVTSTHATGYKGVCVHGGRYEARICENGEQTRIGCFGTAEEAALQLARRLGPARSAAAAAAAATTSGRSRKRPTDARPSDAPVASLSGRIRRAPSKI
jgi:hypothetical protein